MAKNIREKNAVELNEIKSNKWKNIPLSGV